MGHLTKEKPGLKNNSSLVNQKGQVNLLLTTAGLGVDWKYPSLQTRLQIASDINKCKIVCPTKLVTCTWLNSINNRGK